MINVIGVEPSPPIESGKEETPLVSIAAIGTPLSATDDEVVPVSNEFNGPLANKKDGG